MGLGIVSLAMCGWIYSLPPISSLSLESQGAIYSTLLMIVVIVCHRICKLIRNKRLAKQDAAEAAEAEAASTISKHDHDSAIKHATTPHLGGRDADEGAIRLGKEEQGSGVMTFEEFQMRYLVVYAVAFIADYVGAAYVYSMFSDYLNLPPSTVLHLMQIPYIGTALAALIISPLVDSYGRRLGFAMSMILFCARYFVVILCPPYDISTAGPGGSPPPLVFLLCIISQVLYGIALALLYSVPECWMVAEHSRRGYPVELMTSTYSRSYFINAIVGIVGVQGARWYREWCGLNPRVALGIVLGFGGITCAIDAVLTMLLWTENTGRAQAPSIEASKEGGGELVGHHQRKVWWQQLPDIPRLLVYATICIFSSFQIFAVGLGQCLQEAGSWIFVGIWTPVLETKEYENVLTSQLLLQGLGSYASQFICRGDDTVASVLGLPADPAPPRSADGAEPKKKRKAGGLSIRSTVLAYHVILLAGLGACALAPTKPWFLVANLASTFGYGFYFSVYGNLKALVVPKEGRTVIVSLFALPAALVTYFGSQLFDATKPQAMYWLAFLYQALSLVIMVISGVAVWMKRNKRRLDEELEGEKLPLWHPDNESIAIE